MNIIKLDSMFAEILIMLADAGDFYYFIILDSFILNL